MDEEMTEFSNKWAQFIELDSYAGEQSVKYLAEKNNKTEFNSLIQHGIKSSFKMTSAEVRKYRQLFNQYRKKQNKKK